MSIQRAIDALSDPTINIDDALRNVLIVGSRIKSEPIKEWVNLELYGYPDQDAVPNHRRLDQGMLRVDVHFSGYGGREFSHSLGFSDLPEELDITKGGFALAQPASSLARLAASGEETKAAMPLPTQWCSMYNHLSDRIALQTPFAQAVAAEVRLDKGMIGDIVSAVRSSALQLLLDLEEVDPHVGEPGGPTVRDSEDLKTVELRIGELHGNIVVAAGSGNQISSHSSEGDLTIIYEKAAEYLPPEEIENLKEALSADGGRPGEQTAKFMNRVRAGAVNLVGGITASAAYDGLSLLLQSQF